MRSTEPRSYLKELLGNIPGAASLYQSLRPGIVPAGAYELDRVLAQIPRWNAVLDGMTLQVVERPRRLLILGNLKWWLEYGIALGMVLKAAGHEVDLAFLPYRDWVQKVSRFNALRGARYIEQHLRSANLPLGVVSLLQGTKTALPAELAEEMEIQASLDVQYTLQREDIDLEHDPRAAEIFQLRLQRNREAAASALNLLRKTSYDCIILPNGSILEFGAVYRVARNLTVPCVTYEFGEQRERVWIAQDDQVMRLDTSELWGISHDVPISGAERAKLDTLFEARRGGLTWKQFKRRWQAGLGEGAERAKEILGLDSDRPIVLLCTNVVGDSLALNRQIFTSGMADWLRRTVEFFSHHAECQLVVRVHPGEMLGAGHPSVEIVNAALPHQLGHVNVVAPDSEINTYDLIELAHLGLVYTTTVGLELCMHGVPVVVAGSTHYRGKGFTSDPETWEEYLQAIHTRLAEPAGQSLPQDRIDRAWRYAYRFFFDYPFRFPWHLLSFWKDIDRFPLEQLFAPERLSEYQATLDAFAGKPIDWSTKTGIHFPAEVEVAR